VRHGGILLSLPSLLVNGLLKFSKGSFSIPQGYYDLQAILLTLSFCALLRLKSLEQVRYCDVGELGKSIGLDRIPEVKTLRNKIKHMASHGDPDKWSQELSKYWMEENPDASGILYFDGHIRVYNGGQTKLPKKFVSREKLCLPGVTDYWVNDALGSPFFVVTKVVSEGLLKALEKDIVPRLLKDVPKQPTKEDLEGSKYLSRFLMVFDREGYSPEFFKKTWEDQRIACTTYKKNVKDKWPSSEFKKVSVKFPTGESVEMKLAERGVYHSKTKFWFREVRKLSDSGKQTTIITTDYASNSPQIAGHMFSRWSQENFFKYMMQHFEIDRLISYQLEDTKETLDLVNPRYRALDGRIRSEAAKLSRLKVKYADLIIQKLEEKHLKSISQKKASIKEQIEDLTAQVESLKRERKETPKKIQFKDLPESEKFKKFSGGDKQVVDCVKMIAYRAETTMANFLRDTILKKDEARNLVRDILEADADFDVDNATKTLNIKLHGLTNPRNSRYAKKLCDFLTETETYFPGSDMRLTYDLVSTKIS
jgi:hypothetical protein